MKNCFRSRTEVNEGGSVQLSEKIAGNSKLGEVERFKKLLTLFKKKVVE